MSNILITNDAYDNEKTLKSKIKLQKKEVVMCSKEDKKKCFLLFLNWIQKKIGSEEIIHITDFKNAKKENLDAIDFNTDNNWELIIFPIFSKDKLRYTRRNSETKSYITSIIRRICNELGYILKGVSKRKIIRNTITNQTIYHIKN